MDKYVGKRLDGRYEIREILGEGGMARVYKAFDNQENRMVAIKILKDEFLSNDEFLRRFKNESKAIAMLSHPNIVNVYDVSFGDLIQYIVMEYIEGITLKEYIENEGSLRWKDAVHFTIQILKALQHAHDKGIVHRDVKPQNIMVLADGTIKVTDFGIARFSRSDQRTITDKAIGSVHYISPEQARGEKTDEKTDIYSVGVMLYEMLTGKLPFQAESAVSVAIMQLQRDPQLPTEINASIPLGLEQITMHAMQKSQDKRYQTASEMLCDLGNFRKDPSMSFNYNYFVDDSPTRFVGGLVDTPEENTPKKNTAQKEKSGILPILTGIAIALVLATVVLFGFALFNFLRGGATDNIPTPKFIGQKLEDIKKNEQYEIDFNFKEEWGHNADYAYGIVYEQSIKEGNKVKSDTDITLYISMGPKTKKVNDVTDKTESAAYSELEANGFKVLITEMASDEYEAGHVIRTEPERYTTVAEGATVTIFVSTGKPTVMLDVPNVVGEPVEQAREKLQDLKLLVTVEEVDIAWNQKYQPKGYVISQTPDSTSKKIPEGTEIKLYVSKGTYKADLDIELPENYEKKICTVSLWTDDGRELMTSEKLDFTKVSTYTFKNVVSTSKTAKYVVKITPENEASLDYMFISVNFRASSKAELVSINHYGTGFFNLW
ncbi:MAG: Stk1 family PASTA domain-containing Ser/Thr kinase [Clostridia bacterium]|nr:Stk1 family PASTA domain-containing Ser/Thr kinase [Clostridia bacterium]